MLSHITVNNVQTEARRATTSFDIIEHVKTVRMKWLDNILRDTNAPQRLIYSAISVRQSPVRCTVVIKSYLHHPSYDIYNIMTWGSKRFCNSKGVTGPFITQMKVTDIFLFLPGGEYSNHSPLWLSFRRVVLKRTTCYLRNKSTYCSCSQVLIASSRTNSNKEYRLFMHAPSNRNLDHLAELARDKAFWNEHIRHLQSREVLGYQFKYI